MMRQRRGAAHDLGEQVEQARILIEQREQLHARRQAVEEFVEADEGGVGIGGPGQGREQRRHQLGQELARALAARRTIAAMVPGAHHRGHPHGVLEAELAQGRERLGIVLAAGEHEIARGAQSRLLLEQLGIVALDPPEVPFEVAYERIGAGIAEEGAERRQALVVARQGMGLLVLGHLQAMLDGPEKAVGVDHLLGDPVGDPSRAGERAQRVAGSGLAQGWDAAAPDELLGLGEELDLADAAAAELDVVAVDLDAAAAAMGVDLALDRVDVLDRREVQMLAPDEGPQHGDEGVAGLDVGRDRTRLDHRRALPVLTHAFVVGFGGIDREGEGCRARIGPEAQIGPEDVAVAGALLHHLHQIARHAHQPLLQARRIGRPHALVVVKHDQVDVARVVELAAAELAHAEDDEAGMRDRPVAVVEGEESGRGRAAQEALGRAVERELGVFAEPGRHLLERPEAGDVREPGQEGGAPSTVPERRLERLARLLRAGRQPRLVEHPAPGLVRAQDQPVADQGDVAHEAEGQERAVAEDRVQERPPLKIACQLAGEIGQSGVGDLVGRLAPAVETEGGELGAAGPRLTPPGRERGQQIHGKTSMFAAQWANPDGRSIPRGDPVT